MYSTYWKLIITTFYLGFVSSALSLRQCCCFWHILYIIYILAKFFSLGLVWRSVLLLSWLTCSSSTGLLKKPRLSEAKIFQIRHLPAQSLGRTISTDTNHANYQLFHGSLFLWTEQNLDKLVIKWIKIIIFSSCKWLSSNRMKLTL